MAGRKPNRAINIIIEEIGAMRVFDVLQFTFDMGFKYSALSQRLRRHGLFGKLRTIKLPDRIYIIRTIA